jgi:GNAT superfamily N-acetyltransferase
MSVRVERFGPALCGDFCGLHSDANEAGWCRCVAWWVPTWDGWGDRSAAENAALRDALGDRGEYDGLLAYDGDEPVGWCQVGQRDRLEKLVRQLDLEPSPNTWAVSCFLIAPHARGRGIARALLAAAVETARSEGATHLEGYPRREGSDPDELWTGPEGLFLDAGFAVARDSLPRALVALELG